MQITKALLRRVAERVGRVRPEPLVLWIQRHHADGSYTWWGGRVGEPPQERTEEPEGVVVKKLGSLHMDKI